MARDASLTFLGTATSVGVPVIGCDCPVCQSDEPRNNRTRSSVVVQAAGTTLLVDSGPDLRLQALRQGLRHLDAVLYTHGHLDHVAGFDELRAFCWQKEHPLPLHATPDCMATLQRMFGWAFFPERHMPGYVRPEAREISGPFSIGEIHVTPLPVLHADVDTLGFLFRPPDGKNIAYIPDVKVIPDATMDLIRGVDVLVVDALRRSGHVTHYSLAEALAAAKESQAGETWLTHLSHDYDAANPPELPDRVQLAWDGLRIPL